METIAKLKEKLGIFFYFRQIWKNDTHIKIWINKRNCVVANEWYIIFIESIGSAVGNHTNIKIRNKKFNKSIKTILGIRL